MRIELFLTEPEPLSPRPPLFGYFECAISELGKLTPGSVTELDGIFVHTIPALLHRPRISSDCFARFVLRGEGFWYVAALVFVPPDINLGADWLAMLRLQADPLDTFYSLEAESDRRAESR
jgi:hypothetical protein